MKKHFLLFSSVLLVAALCIAQDAPHKKAAAPAHKSHVVVTPDELKWGPPPETWIKGTPSPEFPALKSQFAVVNGDPTKSGAPFVIRIKSPDGEKIPPHWHPQDEQITVFQGTLHLAIGEKFDEKAGHALAAGTYALMPKRTMHFAWTKGETIIQIHGMGPFVINFGKVEEPAKKPSTSQ